MATSEEMARMAFGDPGFFDFLARGFKTVAPALGFGASFIPGVGPFISKAIEGAAGLVADEHNPSPGVTDDQDDTSEDA